LTITGGSTILIPVVSELLAAGRPTESSELAPQGPGELTMLTITKLENGHLEFDISGEKLVGKFYGDGSGKLLCADAVKQYARLERIYGKRQLKGTIQIAVRDGRDTCEVA